MHVTLAPKLAEQTPMWMSTPADVAFDLSRGGGQRAVPTGRASLDVSTFAVCAAASTEVAMRMCGRHLSIDGCGIHAPAKPTLDVVCVRCHVHTPIHDAQGRRPVLAETLQHNSLDDDGYTPSTFGECQPCL